MTLIISEIDQLRIQFHNLPKYVILDSSRPIRKIQSLFQHPDPNYIWPILDELIKDFNDSHTAMQKMRSTLRHYLRAIMEGDLVLDIETDKRRVINSFDHTITIEQAAMDLYELIERMGLRIERKYLVYRFKNVNLDGSVTLEKYHDLEEFWDEVYGRAA